MPILTKEVEVKVNGKTIDYYKSLNYEIPMKKASESYHKKTGKEFIYDLNKTFKVKVGDLQKGSNIKVDVLCDYCCEEVLTMTYDQYIQRTKEVNKIACRKCFPQKVKEVSILRYGVDNYTKTKECRNKYENTMLTKYRVKHNSQLPDYREKYHNTCVERYGEFYGKQFIDKALKTFASKTGYNYSTQSPEVQFKIKQTCLNKFGYKYSLQSPEVREKISKPFMPTLLKRHRSNNAISIIYIKAF